MVKIRLTRLGKHKNPFYRIVVTDSRSKRDGGYISLIGTYEPFSGKTIIKSQEAIEFLKKGAQPTDTILNIFKKEGIWAEYLNTKKSLKKEKLVKKTKTVKKQVKTKK